MKSALPDSLKRVILDAAIAIAGEAGPDAISMRELARQANVSHQAPYHHFGDRAGIFAAISEEGFAGLADSMQASRSLGIEAFCESYVHFALKHKGHFRVMFRTDLCNLQLYPNTLAQADRAFGILLNEVISLLESETDVTAVRTYTTYMWSVAHGLATLLIDGPLLNKIGADTNIESLVKAVVRQALPTLPTRPNM